MVADFLRAEIASPRKSAFVVMAMDDNNVADSLILEPNVSNPGENLL
jgi:hypothetical protein